MTNEIRNFAQPYILDPQLFPAQVSFSPPTAFFIFHPTSSFKKRALAFLRLVNTFDCPEAVDTVAPHMQTPPPASLLQLTLSNKVINKQAYEELRTTKSNYNEYALGSRKCGNFLTRSSSTHKTQSN